MNSNSSRRKSIRTATSRKLLTMTSRSVLTIAALLPQHTWAANHLASNETELRQAVLDANVDADPLPQSR
jgi:hypothetical protein